MPEKKWIVRPQVKKDLIDQIIWNRGIKDEQKIREFLFPSLSQIPDPLSFSGVKKAVSRVKKALAEREPVIVFGDYDADGISGTAILWETLYRLGAEALPFIPSREEGYGLNRNSIQSFRDQGVGLVITTDCGITSVREVEEASKVGIDVIITDHHQKPKKLPLAYSIIHSPELAGVGVAFIFSQALQASIRSLGRKTEFFDLLALGTIADMVPLLGLNRVFAKFGLEKLNHPDRIGLKILIKEAGLKLGEIGAFEVSFMLAPRLNAMGRILHAIDSLRLVCTRDFSQAVDLAKKLDTKNVERQELTAGTFEEAKEMVLAESELEKALILASEVWPEGIIGLVAGRLVEKFQRPAIIISRGGKISKGSARSIPGFNIIENLRNLEGYFVDLGGHPAAAGFSIETEKIEEFAAEFRKIARSAIADEDLFPKLEVDGELDFSEIDFPLLARLKKLEPFGIGNPDPTFLTRGMQVEEKKMVGKSKTHLKLKVKSPNGKIFDAIGFNFLDKETEISTHDEIDLVYTLAEDNWGSRPRIQLKIKDFRKSSKPIPDIPIS